MATIEDVARDAGVSVATVSRVLNNSESVQPKTAAKVRKSIDSLAYVPNMSARNLRRNETRIILILTPNFTNPYYSQVLSGICDVSRDLGYSTLIYNSYDSIALNEKLVNELFHANRADGMITLACNMDDTWLKKYRNRYAIVQCSEYVEGIDMPHISVDNREAAREVVSHLISLGHCRIGIISSTNKYMSSAMRLRGYFEAMEQAGLRCDSTLIACADPDYSFESGKKAAEKLLSLPESPTAIFCVSDILALGVITQAQTMGLKVPEDLSVAGFDDVDYTTMFHPMLTTVAVPCYELGCKSMRLLQKLMQRTDDTEKEIYLPHMLRIRESSAKIAAK